MRRGLNGRCCSVGVSVLICGVVLSCTRGVDEPSAAADQTRATAAGDRSTVEVPSTTRDGTPIGVPLMYDVPVDLDESFLPPEFPAGLDVLLDAQADPSENGLYTSGTDGRLVGPPRPVATFENAATARMVVIGQTVGGLSELPLELTLSATTGADLRVVAPASDGTFELRPVQLTPESLLDLTGRAFPPAWNDFAVDRDTQLTLNHAVTSVDTSDGDVTLTMGPHATIVRPTFVWNRTGGGRVTIVNLPGDGDEFRHVLEPGERVVVLPDGAAWHAWPMLPADGSLPYRPSEPSDWDEVPADVGAALDELAERLRPVEEQD